MNAGEQLASYVDELYLKLGRPLTLVETGCLRRDDPAEEVNDGWSTLYFAKWAAENNSQFFSVDIDPDHISVASKKLASDGLAIWACFSLWESVDYLEKFASNIDFAYLDTSDGWWHGLAEFKAAESKNAQLIVMDDFDSKVLWADKYARESGRWNVSQEGRFTVMRHV